MQRPTNPSSAYSTTGTAGAAASRGRGSPSNEPPSSVASHAASELSDEVRRTVASAHHNQAEVLVAPNEYIEQLDQRFIDSLETVSVTPEAPWDDQGESLLRDWMAAAQASASAHQRTGYKLKFRHKALQFSSIMSAVVVFIVSTLFPCTKEDPYRYIQVTASGVAVGITQVQTFLNYGTRYREHFEYEGHYIRFATDIEELLVTDRDFRAPKDKSITEFRERKKQLVNAPEL